MAIQKIRPLIIDETQNYVFNNVTATGNLTTSNANLGNLAVANYITGVLTTGNQPNISNVGTLGTLAVTSNVTAGNIKTDHLLYSNGSPWAMGGTTAVAGSNTQIQFNDSGSFAGSANLTFTNTTNTLSVTNIVANGSLLTALTGANVTGQVANALISGQVYTNAQPNITSVGTLTSLSITGNTTSGNANLGNLATANYFSGNGSALSSIVGANVTGQVSYAAVANSVAGANVSGTVTYAATANAVAGANVLGQVSYAAVANSVAGANVSGQVANALVSGTVYTAAQPNITSVGTLTSLAVTGNLSAGNVNGGNLVVANYISGNGSLLTSITGANVIGTVSAATTAGTVTTASQPNITSVGTLASLVVTGDITSGNANLGNRVTANFFTGNGSLLTGISASSANSVSGANVSGQVADALVAGTVYTNAQPNITSVGTLSSLSVTGVTTLGNVGNVKIAGGANGQYLKTDGTGNLSWAAAAGGGGTSLTYTAATTPPGTANVADQWYNTTTNTLFEYMNDGSANYWVDIQTPALAIAPSNGTLSTVNLSVTGNVNITAANVTLGLLANIHITGGSSGQAILTDGAGNLSFGTGGMPAAKVVGYNLVFGG